MTLATAKVCVILWRGKAKTSRTSKMQCGETGKKHHHRPPSAGAKLFALLWGRSTTPCSKRTAPSLPLSLCSLCDSSSRVCFLSFPFPQSPPFRMHCFTKVPRGGSSPSPPAALCAAPARTLHVLWPPSVLIHCCTVGSSWAAPFVREAQKTSCYKYMSFCSS